MVSLKFQILRLYFLHANTVYHSKICFFFPLLLLFWKIFRIGNHCKNTFTGISFLRHTNVGQYFIFNEQDQCQMQTWFDDRTDLITDLLRRMTLDSIRKAYLGLSKFKMHMLRLYKNMLAYWNWHKQANERTTNKQTIHQVETAVENVVKRMSSNDLRRLRCL